MRPRLLSACLLGMLAALAGCAAPRQAQPAAAPVEITYVDGPQVEIVSPGGTRILIDVADQGKLVRPATEKDILLTTNYEVDWAFARSFPGPHLTMSPGTLAFDDVVVRGIASSYHGALSADPARASNYIYVIETGGLRLAHFGHIGQGELTREQLDSIGRVDIAFSQFAQKDSGISVVNKKGFILMDQVRPAVIIPYHFDMPAAEYAVSHWSGRYLAGSALSLSPGALPEPTTVIFMGEGAESLGKLLKIEPWSEEP